MRILVTGSLGVLGSALVPELGKHHKVFGCDLLHSSAKDYMRADIANACQLARVFEWARPELVFNLAAEFGRVNGHEFYEQLWQTNCIGLRNVIEECLKSGARLVHASSSEAYGCGRLIETDDGFSPPSHFGVYPVPSMSESDVSTTFHNEYALTKWANEKQIEIARQRGLKAISLRTFNVYGREPYTPYRSVVCQFIWKLLKGEPVTVYADCHRDFLYIDDWVATVCRIPYRVDWLKEPVYNIGGEESVSMLELFSKIEHSGWIAFHDESRILRLTVEPNNVQNKKPDLTLIKRDLDHKITVSLEEGIRRTVEWMREKSV